ncbi:MAG: hypothetical protein HZB39_12040 [Planctomycetes bacterium]|nr:hypothetical protein [Planctomycetota bacterium]
MPRRRTSLGRFLRTSAILAVILVGVVFAIPALLSMDWLRERTERQASELLGTELRIGNWSLGWFSGLEIEDVAVANPEGFPADRKLFELKSLRGDASLIDFMRGRAAISGVVDGLALRVVQRRDGTTNLGELLGVRASLESAGGDRSNGRGVRGGSRSTGRGSGGHLELGDLRLDLQLRDAFIEVVHEDRGVLERLEHVEASVAKEYGTNTVRVDFACDLARPAGGAPGRLEIRVDAQADAREPIDLRVRAVDLDLARYRPILESFLPADRVTGFAGVVTANAQVTGAPADRLTIDGSIDVVDPHFAGAWLGGLDLGAPRWTLKPLIAFGLPHAGESLRVDVERLSAELGFLTVRGLPIQAGTDGAPARAGLGFTLDVAALAARGGTIPAFLKGSGTKLEGELRLPLDAALAGSLADLDADRLIAALGLSAKLGIERIAVGGQDLGGVVAELGVDHGRIDLRATSGTYGGGPLQFRLTTDATRLDAMPTTIEASVDGAKVGVEALRALQYVFPLAAGGVASAASSTVALDGVFALRLSATGPGRPAAGEDWNAWLDRWSGNGTFAMPAGKLRPAASLAQLASLTGERAELSFSGFANQFAIRDGAVTSAVGKLVAKGKEFGLTGTTSLAGGLDWVLDVKPLLADHKDGRAILQFLGDAPLGAALRGTLTTPTLAMPRLDELATQALQKVIERGAGERLRDEAKKVIDGVIPPNAPLDAARSTLESIIQGQQPGTPGTAPPVGPTGPTRPRPDPIGDMLRQVIERRLREQQQAPPPSPPAVPPPQPQTPPRRDG